MKYVNLSDRYSPLIWINHLLSIWFFVLFLRLPILHIHTSVSFLKLELSFHDEQISFVDSIWYLFEANQYFLAVFLVLFVGIFPVLKLACYTYWLFRQHYKPVIGKVLFFLSRYSLTDTMLVALTVVLLSKTKNGTIAQMEDGIIYLTLSVITAFVTATYIKSKFSSTPKTLLLS